MAYQLIYTSAPRLLEAGRSGFGTVARHREIPPLIVTALERISQFSRLPGSDTSRVIYAHRVLTAGGRNLHVLSAIRDAGADYTGRTNHIAHHLVVDPREITALGPACPSPAEVLQAMEWAAAWQGSPLFLDGAHQVDLATLRRALNGSPWERLTGQADQAWLLAAHGTNRGVCLISPSTCDLREIYAESLRLTPERLWQVSFTTSLQPSDEISDFRWTGIEEHSALRAQIESSGRLVLNLADPKRLPHAGKPKQESAAAPSPSSPPLLPRAQGGAAAQSHLATGSSTDSATPYPEGSGNSLSRLTHFPAQAREHERREDFDAPFPRKSAQRSRGATWKLIGAAVFILGMLFAFREVQNRKHLEVVFSGLERQQNEEGYGYFQEASRDIQAQIRNLGSRVIPFAQALFTGATQAVVRTKEGDIEGAQKALEKAREALQGARQAGVGLNMPSEINGFEDQLEKFSKLKQKIDFQKKDAEFTVFQASLKEEEQELKALLESAQSNRKNTIFDLPGKALKEKLQTQKEFEAAYNTMIYGKPRLEENNRAKFEATLKELKGLLPSDYFSKNIKRIEDVLEDWKKISKWQASSGSSLPNKKPNWPDWLETEWVTKQSEVVKTETLPVPKPEVNNPAPVSTLGPMQNPSPQTPESNAAAENHPIYILSGVNEFQKEKIDIKGRGLRLRFETCSKSRPEILLRSTNEVHANYKYFKYAENAQDKSPIKFIKIEDRGGPDASGKLSLCDLQELEASEKNKFHEITSESFVITGASDLPELKKFQIFVKVSEEERPLWSINSAPESFIARNGNMLIIDVSKIPVRGKPVGELSVTIEGKGKTDEIGKLNASWNQKCIFSLDGLKEKHGNSLKIEQAKLEEANKNLEELRINFSTSVLNILSGTLDFFKDKNHIEYHKKFLKAQEEIGKNEQLSHFFSIEDRSISLKNANWVESIKGAKKFTRQFNDVFQKVFPPDVKVSDGKALKEIEAVNNMLDRLREISSGKLLERENELSTAQKVHKEKVEKYERELSQMESANVPRWRYKLEIKTKNQQILLLDIDLRNLSL
jgi:hypothetical protein